MSKKNQDEKVVEPMSVEAVPVPASSSYAASPFTKDAQQQFGAAIPPGHSRFYCSKCHTVREALCTGEFKRRMACRTLEVKVLLWNLF